jgi:4-hydroxybenzoate polyprenyltransferase
MTSPNQANPGQPLQFGVSWMDYLALARPEHWVKLVFILPGIVLAYLLRPTDPLQILVSVALGFCSAAAASSANHVLNEWLDASYDVHHPTKAERPAVAKSLSGKVVAAEYVALAVIALGIAWLISSLFFWTTCLFLVSGLVYNLPPLRSKETAFLGVLTESFNNPIRLTLGWAMVDSTTLPPSSLVLAYWMGGAFLMALKRLAEYRSARASGHLGSLMLYRNSFRIYTEESLLMSAFLYALLAAFFVAVFLIKYRVEYLLSLALFAYLFVSYLRIALKSQSTALAPERLYREKTLIVLVVVLAATLLLLTWIDLPFLDKLSDPHHIEL